MSSFYASGSFCAPKTALFLALFSLFCLVGAQQQGPRASNNLLVTRNLTRTPHQNCNCTVGVPGCASGCRKLVNDVNSKVNGNANGKANGNANGKGDAKVNSDAGGKWRKEVEMQNVRIEEIKMQILKKLRLKNRPNATINKNMVPLPIKEWDFPLRAHENKVMDDFYAKTEQVIVMADNTEHPSCPTFFHDPAGCFSFRLTSDVTDKDIASAELWVFKLRDERDQYNQTYYVSEFVKDNHIVGRRTNTVAIRDTSIKDGWLKFDVSSTVRRWIQKSNVSNVSHTLEVSCKTCAMDQERIPVSNDPGEQPFIIINLGHRDDLSRKTRGVRCETNSQVCCLETLFVNFTDIGWDDWIYQPLGYFANYCRGSCLGDISLGTNGHSSIIQRYALKYRKNLSAVELANLSPCCTSTNTSPLSIFYEDGNGQIKLDSIPHMTVESCGCN